jgi:hypothetical protein
MNCFDYGPNLAHRPDRQPAWLGPWQQSGCGGGGGTPVAHASDVTTAPVVVRVAVSTPKRNEVAGESKRGT